jgi:hypothetical protein
MMDAAEFVAMTSKKGWATVAYKRTLWIPCLVIFPEGVDEHQWARDFSAAWWSMSGLPHGTDDLARLEAQLFAIYEHTYEDPHGRVPCHQAFIHLPDPRMLPLPVFLAIFQTHDERNAQLRTLTMADDPAAARPPIVEDFTTDKLGTGLRVLRHFSDEPGQADAEIDAGLSYAWRSEEYETDLRLFTACPDLGRLQQAIPDIDELAQAITIVPSQR